MEKYIRTTNLTKEEFFEQFSAESEEIVARVHWAQIAFFRQGRPRKYSLHNLEGG